MNIISGLLKNFKFSTPDDTHTHPMGSREKLALFNMISPYLPSSVVLDAFAGSGAIGLESLSRGAAKVVFLEKSPKIAKIIKNNLQNLPSEFRSRTEIVISDATKFITPSQFDIIIADPPYNLFSLELIENLPNYLKSGGIFVLSSPKTATIPELTDLELLKTHTYAAASISLYRKK